MKGCGDLEQSVTLVGVIFSIHRNDQQQSIQLDGIDQFGLIVHIDSDTELLCAHGKALSFDELEISMVVKVEHPLALTMSIPPQTYAYQVMVLQS